MQLNGIYQDSTTQVGDPWVWDGIIRSALAEGPKVSADAAMPPFAQPTWHHGGKKTGHALWRWSYVNTQPWRFHPS